MRNLLLIIGLLLLSHFITAQGSLNGTIMDKNGEPLPGVAVVLQGADRATATDADGFFMFNRLEKQSYTLEVATEGFKKLSEKVEITGRNSADFELKSNCWYYWIRFRKCR